MVQNETGMSNELFVNIRKKNMELLEVAVQK